MLGIDVSKDSLCCTLFDPVTQKLLWHRTCGTAPVAPHLWHRTVANTSSAISLLLKQTPPESAWALEPTGRYSLLAATQVRQAGRDVLLAQPKKARHFLHSIQSRAKTDVLDSHGIGLFALCRSLPAYPLKSTGAPWAGWNSLSNC